jgi:hypothetical protein
MYFQWLVRNWGKTSGYYNTNWQPVNTKTRRIDELNQNFSRFLKTMITLRYFMGFAFTVFIFELLCRIRQERKYGWTSTLFASYDFLQQKRFLFFITFCFWKSKYCCNTKYIQ